MVIIGYEDRYNFFSTVSDTPIYDSALTAEQLVEVIKIERGKEGLRGLEGRMERVKVKGTSSAIDSSLQETILIFLSNADMSYQEFLDNYLSFSNGY